MNTPPPNRNLANLFHLIATHPYGVPLLGGIASIVAIPLALLLWRALPRHRELTYAIQPIRTALAQETQNTNITVFYKGKQITNDLTVAQVTVFNSGDEPIMGSDIVSTIKLTIAHASILEVSLSITSKIGTDLVWAIENPNKVAIGWKILEKGDSPVLQVLYAGKRDAQFVLEGRIREQTALKEVAWPNKPPLNGWVVLVAPVCSILLWVCILGIFRSVKPTVYYKVEKRLWSFTLFAMLVVAGSIISILVHALWTVITHW